MISIVVDLIVNHHVDILSFTSDTGSDAVEISDIEADFATGVGLDTCTHDDNNND